MPIHAIHSRNTHVWWPIGELPQQIGAGNPVGDANPLVTVMRTFSHEINRLAPIVQLHGDFRPVSKSLGKSQMFIFATHVPLTLTRSREWNTPPLTWFHSAATGFVVQK